MTSALWKPAALKMACCGGPLLVLLVASGTGAGAGVDVALGAALLGLVAGGWLLWRRRRACARGCQPSSNATSSSLTSSQASARRPIASWRASEIEREERMA
ncbi:MAG TPA: hypothetical protein VGR11_13775 [Solirubrobacteraceae bacterium]|nr:hypothetical protein [Solirubrobacteraceae bacterium]